MRPGPACGRWLTLLCGAALAAFPPPPLHAGQDDPPAGFVWADCKGYHARMLRPASWLARQDPLTYLFSPETFAGTNWLEKGLTFYACPVSQAEPGKTADEMAAAEIAQNAAKHGARRGTTKVGVPPGPFTTYSLTFPFARPSDGKCFVMTTVYIANRETGMIYIWLLRSPSAEWREVEPFEDVMLKSLQLDPKF